MNKLLQTRFAVPCTVYFIFAIKLRKFDIGYPNSVVNAGKHTTTWRRATEPYLFSDSTYKTTESKVSTFEIFKIYEASQIFSLQPLLTFKRSGQKQTKTRQLALAGFYGEKPQERVILNEQALLEPELLS